MVVGVNWPRDQFPVDLDRYFQAVPQGFQQGPTVITAVLRATGLSGTYNNFDPQEGNKSISDVARVLLATGGAVTITGVKARTAGQELVFFNEGPDPVTFRDDHPDSEASNRFELGVDITIPTGGSITLWYNWYVQRWYNSSGASSGGGSGSAQPEFNVAADIEDSAIPASIKVVRVHGHTTPGLGGGYYQRSQSEPVHSTKRQSLDRFKFDGTSHETDGGWWELLDDNGTIYPTQFGATPHLLTSSDIQGLEGTLPDVFPVWEDIQLYMFARKRAHQPPTLDDDGVAIGAGRRTGFRIVWPQGLYYSSESWEIKDVIQWHYGFQHPSHNNPGASVIWLFARDKTGVRFNYHRTRGIPGTVEDSATSNVLGEGSYTGQGSGIDGVVIRSFGGGRDTADGIQIKAPCWIRNCVVMNWGRDGVNIHAQAITSDPTIRGQGNLFELYSILTANNARCGVFCSGGDSNAGIGIRVVANNNGQYGINDSSFLGNLWLACHTNTNGVKNVGQSASGEGNILVGFVSDKLQVSDGGPGGGNRYCVMYGKDVEASTTIPGTDPSVWQFVSAGDGSLTGFCPVWSEGTTYRHISNYVTTNINSISAFIGCYAEGGTTPCTWAPTTTIMGGLLAGPTQMAAGPHNPPVRIIGTAGFLQTGAGFKQRFQHIETLNFRNITFGGQYGADDPLDLSDDWLTFQDDLSTPSTTRVQVHNVTGDVTWGYSSNAATWTINGPGTTRNCGRASPVTNCMWIRFLWFGAFDVPRQLTNAATVPTSGEWARGDIIFKQTPSAAGKVGWVCTTGGVAGSTAVFKEWGVIDA